MRRMKSLLAACIVAAVFVSCQSSDQKNKRVLKDQVDSLSYTLGLHIGDNVRSNLGQAQIDMDSLNMKLLLEGMKNVIDSSDIVFDEETTKQVMEQFQEDQQRKQIEAQKEQAKAHREAHKEQIEEGEAFLEENKAKEGVKELPSGLQYEVLEEGTGPKPDLNDTVKIHYVGKLPNGKVFDSSREREEALTSTLIGKVTGWTEGVQQMKEGARWKLYVPYDLGYGEQGKGDIIKPYSVLVFDIELLDVKKVEGDGAEDKARYQQQMKMRQRQMQQQMRQQQGR